MNYRICDYCKIKVPKVLRRCPNCKRYLIKPYMLKQARNAEMLRLLKEEAWSIDEVAEKFGISRQRAHQIYQREVGKHYIEARNRKRERHALIEDRRLNTIRAFCENCHAPILVKDRKIKYCIKCSKFSYLNRDPGTLQKCSYCGVLFHPLRANKGKKHKNFFCTNDHRLTFMKINNKDYFSLDE